MIRRIPLAVCAVLRQFRASGRERTAQGWIDAAVKRSELAR